MKNYTALTLVAVAQFLIALVLWLLVATRLLISNLIINQTQGLLIDGMLTLCVLLLVSIASRDTPAQ